MAPEPSEGNDSLTPEEYQQQIRELREQLKALRTESETEQ